MLSQPVVQLAAVPHCAVVGLLLLAMATVPTGFVEVKMPPFDNKSELQEQPFVTDEYAMKWDGEWRITYEVFRDLGLHGRSGMRKLLLGSVAERVLRTADRPVLAIRGEASGDPPEHVVCTSDDPAVRATAEQWAEARGASFRTGEPEEGGPACPVLYVVEASPPRSPRRPGCGLLVVPAKRQLGIVVQVQVCVAMPANHTALRYTGLRLQPERTDLVPVRAVNRYDRQPQAREAEAQRSISA